MHYIFKLIRILINRACRRIRPEIGQEPRSFVQDTGTKNAIFMIGMQSEQTVQIKNDLYLYFIDCTNTFDDVRHKGPLEKLDLHGKDIHVIRYWK